ncbi:unnamed protein product, partial [marine sediment metagenome]
AFKEKIPVLPAGFVVGGTFGTSSLSFFNSIPSKTNVRLHVFQGEANLSDLWASDPFTTAYVDLQGSVQKRSIDFSTMQDGNQFQTIFRRIGDWRMILANPTGLIFNIPVGRKVTLTFKVRSVSLTEDMNLVR